MDLIARLRRRCARKPANAIAVRRAETSLGFSLPPLVERFNPFTKKVERFRACSRGKVAAHMGRSVSETASEEGWLERDPRFF